MLLGAATAAEAQVDQPRAAEWFKEVQALCERDAGRRWGVSPYAIRNDQERAVSRQEYAVTRAFYTRWQQDLRAGVPTARIVELTGANLYMFLSNEADVIREVRAFAATLQEGSGR